MVRIEAIYENGLRCTATHVPSGKQLITDAPIDNQGKRRIILTDRLTGDFNANMYNDYNWN